MCLPACHKAAPNDASRWASPPTTGGSAAATAASGLSYAGIWLLSLLFVAVILHPAWSAALAKNGVRTTVKPSTEYTDPDQFLRSRVSKLLSIIARAQKAQKRLQPPKTKQARQTYAKWQNIERHARKMLLDIRNNLKDANARERHKKTGPLAKNVMLTRLDGRREKIAKHRGDVVLLHFWATWCRPCVKEIGSLQQIYQDFRGQKFSVVPVSLDARKKDVNRFVRKKALRLPMYFDPSRRVYQQMIGGAEVLPRSLLIDKAGRIARVYAGAQHLQDPAMLADIRRLLAN